MAVYTVLVDWEVARALGVSALLGGITGLERAWRKKPAGLRTHVLVSLGSTLFTLVSAEMARQAGASTDPTRIASNIVTGLGFLGAGTILHAGDSIHGLTTAASLWATGAIGMAIGCGCWQAALMSWVLVLVTLHVLDRIEGLMVDRVGPRAKRALKSFRDG